ncbi:A-kinase anchor protein 6 isoform X2 [Gouania willdenowi]|uniref:A-kinase anchor protein 6 isoform X2 n=1 Tax=Gouania willdenowi TaxID=441366 RepID=UPI001056CF95|nr:A-kinase anchor protein 6 isoform X2 [Gouania willdenowi]
MNVISPTSPMLTSVSPTLDQRDLPQSGSADPPQRSELSSGTERSQKPPPLHTGADWKVVLHLPEIEKWLRATSGRVAQLTHSVGQDGQDRHVDAHLVQLKDICEDISDHVEQIHALLETEFSLKLLSYSVNIIVDIRTVQILWHQLRVSVLVLKERLLQSLQDSNGNFTRQTDILQAFSQEQHQTRLDALTEVDDCGQLTIRCSQDYFSLDCGITAFELSDYSPGEEPENCNTEDPTQEMDQEEPRPSNLPEMQCNQNENAKRSLQGVSRSTDVSPTQPSLPKKAAMFAKARVLRKTNQTELSRSVPTLVDLPDRSRFWLDLDSVYPEQVSQSCESLQVMNERNHHRNQVSSRHKWSPHRPNHVGSPGAAQTSDDSADETLKRPKRRQITHSEEDSDSPLPSPIMDRPFSSSDVDASGEESDPRPPAGRKSIWNVKQHEQKGTLVESKLGTDREHWYGSEEFLALPSHLQKTETLAMKLESLTQSISQGPQSSTQDALQDVDDWDLTDLNQDWEGGANASSDEFSSPPPSVFTHRQISAGRFSPASSSDIAPSLDESIESGELSNLLSEDDEGQRSADPIGQQTAPPVDGSGCASLVEKLLEQIQSQGGESQIWDKIECFVQQLDSFILWLQEALQSTENWTQPRQEVDSLRMYLDTHLSFKLNVESHGTLKENIMEEGKELLAAIGSQHSGLKEILLMVSSQWDQLQRQIRRQHAWMLRALRCIQARLFYTSQSHQFFKPQSEPSANCQPENLKVELLSGQCESQRAALEQMSIKLNDLQYPSPTSSTQLLRNNSLQEYEAEYQELYNWLMDMDAMVTDSHQLMMSEEQRRQLFKSSHVELMMMEARKSILLGRAESLKRSGTELPANFNSRIHNLTQTWGQLERILSEHCELSSSQQKLPLGEARSRSALSPLTNSLLEQLEARIKELKAWLRDTELLIFNSCLRRDKDASQQLASFKSLCSEIRARRRGVVSVLKLCQKLLQQSQCGPMAELCPDAEQHREALQLLSINLERRWEAIVMQALQWQNRLKRQLGEQQVPGNFLDAGLTDLYQMSLVSSELPAPAPDDSWEWDETDMTITETEPDLTHNLPTKANQATTKTPPTESQDSQSVAPNHNSVFQVYSLHHVELYCQPQFHPPSSSLHKPGCQKPLLKNKDSFFSSTESLPDLLGGLTSKSRRTNKNKNWEWENESNRGSRLSVTGRRSESESGIVSDMGDTETATTTSENPGEEEEDSSTYFRAEKGWRREELNKNQESEKRRSCGRPRSEALEILINGHGTVTPPGSESDPETSVLHVGLENHPSQVLSTVVSPGSSLESLLALGVELFPLKDPLQRSASLESCVIHSPELAHSPEVSDVSQRRGSETGEPSAGELSRRTLDLLKRLENIQSPMEGKMTRSVSDMILPSGFQQQNNLRSSPSLGGCRTARSEIFGLSSLINPSTTSLTDLSSAEDTSQCSDEFRNQKLLLLDPAAASNGNSGFNKRRCLGNRLGVDEWEAASLSMVVNVSACTDDDEDNSDLLSSSTLTLTEEEFGVRDEEDREEEQLDRASSWSEENDHEEDMDDSYLLGVDYMKKGLQSWIRPARTFSSKTEMSLRDELQCGTRPPSMLNMEQRSFSSCPARRFLESNSCENTAQILAENKKKATRNYISQLVDDVENGNVDLRTEDHDDQLLREEASVFTKKGATAPHAYETLQDIANQRPKTQPHSSSLVGELKGELPCQSYVLPSSPSLSPVEDPLENDRRIRKAITIQEKCKFSSFVTEETRKEVRVKHSSLPPRKSHRSHSCCSHQPSTSPPQRKENVHDFVMKIIDMTSLALRSKDTESQELHGSESTTEQTPASQLRDKVLEHSHRPLNLRKVDFYSYLSLSSHDSDCGEVSQCAEDKSSTPAPDATSTPRFTPEPASPTSSPPPSPDIRDEEMLFEACTEEVYLGPPLCYSMVLTRKPRQKENPESSPAFYSLPYISCSDGNPEYPNSYGPSYLSVRGSTPDTAGSPCPQIESSYISKDEPSPRLPPQGENSHFCDAAGESAAGVSAALQERSGNEGPPYLNPCARVGLIDSLAAAKCLADTKAFKSNMDPVMTKISVCGSATNPSKEPAATNPKINRRPMREADRKTEERQGGTAAMQGEEERKRKGRSGSEGKPTAVKQVSSADKQPIRVTSGRSQGSLRPPTSRPGNVKRVPFLGAGASRVQL